MFETGLGIINPMFFVGVVENNLDPRLEGRVQIRAFGVHGTNEQIKTEDLPWATLVIGSHDVNFVKPPINSWVFGFFIDGRDAQQPMVLGLIPTQYLEPINPSVTGWGVSFGKEVDNAGQGSRASDIGQPRNSRLDRGEDLQNTYVPSVETNRVRQIPIAGGMSTSLYPKGNMGVASQDDGQTSTADPSNIPTGSLKDDKEFQSVLAEMKAKYPGLTDAEIYRTIGGESSFNPRALNASTNAAGLFQFIPKTARGLGISSQDQIVNMSPADQLRLYDRYLSSNGYQGGPLGIMQAAPAFANKPGGTTVYDVGSRAWELNPGWRSAGNGPCTVDSINAYYAGQPAPSSPSYNTSAAAVSAGNGTSDGASGTFWDEPTVGYNAKYPYNRVIETSSGHSIELDDTPGSERIMIYHKSGSYIQITNSSTTYKNMNDTYELHEDNHMVYVGGTQSITIDGDSYVLVKGNKIEEIVGDYRQIIHGNHEIGVAGQAAINASDELLFRAAKVGIESNVENLNLKTAKTIRFSSGENIHLKTKNMFIETEENLNIKANNTMFIEGTTAINMKSGDDVRIGSPRVHIKTENIFAEASSDINFKSTNAFLETTNLDMKLNTTKISTSTLSVDASGAINMKSGATFNAQSGGNLNLKSGGSVYVDGSTVYLDDIVRMAGGASASAASTSAAAAAVTPDDTEAATGAEPANEVKKPEPPAKSIATTGPTSGPQ